MYTNFTDSAKAFIQNLNYFFLFCFFLSKNLFFMFSKQRQNNERRKLFSLFYIHDTFRKMSFPNVLYMFALMNNMFSFR